MPAICKFWWGFACTNEIGVWYIVTPLSGRNEWPESIYSRNTYMSDNCWTSDVISPSLPQPVINYLNPALQGSMACIQSSCKYCHVQAAGYEAIAKDLIGIISPSLPQPVINYLNPAFRISVACIWSSCKYCYIQAAGYHTITQNLAGQISQTLPYAIIDETSRQF